MIYPTHSARRINALHRHFQFRHYLEIGVFAGTTIFGVDIANKVGVDPKFQFDGEASTDGRAELFQETSDKFFTEHAHDRVFDMIFLDGMHQFEQTFRDFCASISCSHRRTVWLIDDTVPRDVYSTLRTMDDAHRFRREESGSPHVAWHGDVFKVAFAIHDFFPTFRFVTIKDDSGNPQTIAWQQPRALFAPRFNNLETISRLTYFDFVDNGDLMNYLHEKEAIDTVISALR